MSNLPPSEMGPPHGVSLFVHAQISARIAEGDAALGEILAAHGIDELQWNESTLYWLTRMGDSPEPEDRKRVTDLYSDAYTKAQDGLKPVRPMGVEEWAELSCAVEREGPAALAERGLNLPDYLRLTRHFTRAFLKDDELDAAFVAARDAIARRGARIEG